VWNAKASDEEITIVSGVLGRCFDPQAAIAMISAIGARSDLDEALACCDHEYRRQPWSAVRWSCLEAIALRPPGHAEAAVMLRALRDPEPACVRVAARWFGRMEDPRCVTGLIAALPVADAQSLGDIAVALGVQRDGRAIDPLLEQMGLRSEQRADWTAIFSAVRALRPTPLQRARFDQLETRIRKRFDD
jgi:HEAT repeat protein